MSKLTKLPPIAPQSMPVPPTPPESLEYVDPMPHSREYDETPGAAPRIRRDQAEHVIDRLRKCDIGDIEDVAFRLVRYHTALASLLFNSLGAADARRQQEIIQAQQRQKLDLRTQLPDSHPMMQPRGS